ncbi:MAG: hypothetical protein LBJ62_05860 [Bifidobacteriaceae bacterium]|jgi:hypothetical protein|nr:hypothetical protein [Bifidobacteriaceae bacterium]
MHQDRAAVRPNSAKKPGELPSLFLGPANYAGQAYMWGRSLERAGLVKTAENFIIEEENAFGYRFDVAVPATRFRSDKTWQAAQFEHLSSFSHVMFEAFRPLLGDLYRFDPLAEAEALRQAGVQVAMLAHGSEVRITSRHAQDHPDSPFRGASPAELVPLERLARRNAILARAFPGPLFVSTPDLLEWLPNATWCPVVVEVERWRAEPTDLTKPKPVVVHAPSNAGLKGTEAVRQAVAPLHQAGRIEYRELTNVPAAEMPRVYQTADIVLDQFALGIYGAAAVEAMAAGRLVISDVSDSVRRHVAVATGLELPVYQARPGDLRAALEHFLAEPSVGHELAALGPRFARQVHSGQASAEVLSNVFLKRADQ